VRCPWCGNTNPPEAIECAYCQKDLVRDQSTQDAVDLLQSIVPPEPETVCPACGSSNFLTTEFCSLCHSPLRPDAVRPVRRWRPSGPTLFDRLDTRVPMMWKLGLLVAILTVWGVMVFADAVGREYAKRATRTTSQAVAARDAAQTEQEVWQAPEDRDFEQNYYKRSVPKQKVSAKERAEIAAEEAAMASAGTFGDSGDSARGSVANGHYVLPLPAGSTPMSSSQSIGKNLTSGVRVFEVNRSVDDAAKVYDDSAFWASLSRQGLESKGSSGLLDTESYNRGKRVYVSYTRSVGVEGRSECAIEINLRPTEAGSSKRTRITVTYTIPRKSSLRMQ